MNAPTVHVLLEMVCDHRGWHDYDTRDGFPPRYCADCGIIHPDDVERESDNPYDPERDDFHDYVDTPSDYEGPQ